MMNSGQAFHLRGVENEPMCWRFLYRPMNGSMPRQLASHPPIASDVAIAKPYPSHGNVLVSCWELSFYAQSVWHPASQARESAARAPYPRFFWVLGVGCWTGYCTTWGLNYRRFVRTWYCTNRVLYKLGAIQTGYCTSWVLCKLGTELTGYSTNWVLYKLLTGKYTLGKVQTGVSTAKYFRSMVLHKLGFAQTGYCTKWASHKLGTVHTGYSTNWTCYELGLRQPGIAQTGHSQHMVGWSTAVHESTHNDQSERPICFNASKRSIATGYIQHRTSIRRQVSIA